MTEQTLESIRPRVIERLIYRFKPCRRIATRYAKRARNDWAMAVLAAIRIWL